MTQTATYKQAIDLMHELKKLGVNAMPETLDMKTSGIFIPRWLGYSKIPHKYDASTGVAEWFFFLRFHKHEDLNVAEALDVVAKHGIRKLAHSLRKKKK